MDNVNSMSDESESPVFHECCQTWSQYPLCLHTEYSQTESFEWDEEYSQLLEYLNGNSTAMDVDEENHDGGQQEESVLFEPQSGSSTSPQTESYSANDWFDVPKQVLVSKPTFTPENHFTMVQRQTRTSTRFYTTTTDHQITFHNLDQIPPLEMEARITEIFDAIIKKASETLKDDDRIRFHMTCKGWKDDLNLEYRRVDELTGPRVLSAFYKIAQSNGNTQLDADDVQLNILSTNLPDKGSGWTEHGSCRNRIFLQLEKWLQVKRCAITTINDDDLCLARSLVIAIAHYKNQMDPTTENNACLKRVMDGRREQQGLDAKQLHKEAGVDLGPCGLSEIQRFQEHLATQGYKIHVFSANVNFNTVFVGPETCHKEIALLLFNKHFVVLTKMPAFFNTSAFCWKCLKGLNHPNRHRCEKVCYYCQDVNCKAPTPPALNTRMLLCNTCFRRFKNADCLHNHVKNGTCANISRCRKCFRQMYSNEAHRCGLKECKYCKMMVDKEHRCYMQRPNQKFRTSTINNSASFSTKNKKGTSKRISTGQHGKNKRSKKSSPIMPIVYYYDYEATQDTGIHVPNLVVVQQENGTPEGQRIFKNEKFKSSNDKFCDWVFRERCGHHDNKQPIILVAHYFKGYDGYFVLNYLYKNNLLPRTIFTDCKIMCLNIEPLNIKFIDSINFLQMALSKFPATFDLKELKKGYFPHLFNTVGNQNYVGPTPDISFYKPDTMTQEDRKKFLQWHKSEVKTNKVFNMQKELVSYCISDVTILREGCQKYRHLCKEMFFIDPLLESITVASYCQKVYLTHHMPEDTIAILPHGGYGGRSKQSNKALKWLRWMENVTGQDIKYAGKCHGEKRIGPYYVDGYHEETKTVYEFYGCFYHGCPKCFLPEIVNKQRNCTMGEVYSQTLDRADYISSEMFTLVEIWECEYEHQSKSNAVMKNFIEKLHIIDKLNPRDAFFGGRTNAAKLYYAPGPDEKVCYYDVCSLYPAINKYGKMPVGHPIIIPTSTYLPGQHYGFVKCKILPPQDLYHPVLPYRSQERLLFPLCQTCADCRQTTECQHNKEERAITGTWITPEVDKAIEKGYVILQCYEVWHFESTAEYNKNGIGQYPSGLFGSYVNANLKIKQEASGWPAHVLTEDDKAKFIDDFHMKEGILLDPAKISTNPGLRAVSKLMLNSLWGKFGQRENLPTTEYVSTFPRFMELLLSPVINVTNVHIINDDLLMVCHLPKTDYIEPSGRTNIFIAAFTTGLARLKLYALLECLGKDILYYDTDSVIFIVRGGKDPLHDQLGDGLGFLTDEIGDGGYITEFVSGGPKNYGYTTSKGETIFKVCGITQNYQTNQIIGFDKIKAMVLNREDAPDQIVIHGTEIARNKIKGSLFNRNTQKTYSINFKKGIVNEEDNWTVYPYGYCSA